MYDKCLACGRPEHEKLAEAVVPVVVAAALQPLRANAGMSATACHARGDSDGRRRWLDLSALMDQIEADLTGGDHAH